MVKDEARVEEGSALKESPPGNNPLTYRVSTKAGSRQVRGGENQGREKEKFPEVKGEKW